MFWFKYKNQVLTSIKNSCLSQFQGFSRTTSIFQDGRRTDEKMGRCDMVPFPRAKKANVPTLGPRCLVKFPWVAKAIKVKCPLPPPPPPPLHLGLDFDRCIMHPAGRASLKTHQRTSQERLCRNCVNSFMLLSKLPQL